ncbi:hypothetical protein WR25_00181 [Diploscapter pachys]|uniref:Uncharacterized protein n=1 Tax=Diploscapter pachys TaxID=2018661 RepID=A0A2A2M5K2_9BILA|nr:hypothetical protein WR25_00181 [Diploscapter pachys]
MTWINNLQKRPRQRAVRRRGHAGAAGETDTPREKGSLQLTTEAEPGVAGPTRSRCMTPRWPGMCAALPQKSRWLALVCAPRRTTDRVIARSEATRQSRAYRARLWIASLRSQ